MRVLITTQVFPPEIHPTAVMACELADDLCRRGWQVTVACGLPHHPHGNIPEGFKPRLFDRKLLDTGVEVRRVWHITTANRHIAVRIGVMGSQMFSSTLAALGTAPAIVLSFGGPPLVGPVLSGLLARSWRVPLVTVIHDIYPDVAGETGHISNSFVLGCGKLLERAQYQLSRHIVVLGPKSKELLVARGVTESKLSVIPVWLDGNEIAPQPHDTAWRNEHGIAPDRFVILYAGTAGIVSGAEILADVARRLPSRALLIVVGGGSAWNHLRQQLVSDTTLADRLLLFPYQNRHLVCEVQASSNLSLVTLAPGRGLTSVPSKVQAYMAAGRPVLASVDRESDTAELVTRGQFGIVVEPGNVDKIVESITTAMANQDQLHNMGANARKVFEAEFDRMLKTAQYASLLERIARESRGG
jgi:colanic acid biosynthesis glycosyl transferase WcaI